MEGQDQKVLRAQKETRNSKATCTQHSPTTQQEEERLIYKPISLPPWKPRDTRKRKPMINMDLQKHSSMFKIRALVQQLRPNFIEVLQTPDFRKYKAADEIRKHGQGCRRHTQEVCVETQHSTHDSDPAKETKMANNKSIFNQDAL
ncbi:uncharacterized protein Pyn_27771 [Prunus yedoensis var. nudiflora]|uniref:Uncharacterized protein n=1 Tax=Prunus yedoensis var. nudiflora TaxID=2094558 RepID=A0A314ZI07_PRUYE|nr:uncharacterized protein Pyn_27771 [Prunus yedoensis var. nudiflora]